MILVIDDCPRRIEGFREALGRNISVATNRHDAICEIARYRLSLFIVFLDYDGVEGEDIARFMRDTTLGMNEPAVRIHSSNYAGAIKMRDILKDTHDVEIKSYDEIVG